MKKIELFLLVLVMLLGIFLRSPEVVNRNPLFGFDQGRDYLTVRKIVVDHKLTLIGSEVGAGYAGLQGIFHGPYYYYLLTIPFILFGGDPYGSVVLMFVLGVVSLFFGFYFVYREFSYRTALVFTFLMALTLYAQSRFMWNTHPATLLILLVFWLVLKIPQNPLEYFFAAVFLSGLIYGFQLAISVCLVITLYIYGFLILRIRNWRIYLSGLVAILIVCFPFFGFEFRHGFMTSKSVLKILSSFFTSPRTDFSTGIKSHFLNFWFNFRDSFYLSDRFRFWALVVLLVNSLFFLIKSKKSSEKNFIIFLSILPSTSFLVFLLLPGPVWNHYLVHLHLVYIFLFAYFLTKSKEQVFRVLLGIFLILMLPSISKEIIKAKNDLIDYGGVAKMKGKLEAMDYIYQDAGNQKFNVLVFTPPVYDYAYRYLLWWYGGKKYGYVPGDKKEGLFYLWIEPDSKKPWSYNGWLETVIKTGTVLKEEKLPSGFIIQKRYEEK